MTSISLVTSLKISIMVNLTSIALIITMSQNCNISRLTLKNLGIGHCNMEGGLSTNLGKTTEIKDLIESEKLDIILV